MRTGLLRHRITIQANTPIKNDFDEWVDSWANWATVWASIEPLRGNSYFEARQANSNVEGVIKIRYRDGVLPTMRIRFGERYFSIISIVHPQERKRELHLLYTEALD